MVPLILASTLLYPRALNPNWTNGTPSFELPWLAVVIVVSAVAVYAALRSRIVVDPPSVRIVNPWVRSPFRPLTSSRSSPGVGESCSERGGRRHIALAVQCTAGPEPWADVARAVTGRCPSATPEQPALLTELAARVEEHCRRRGYQVTSLGTDEYGYVVFQVSLPARDHDVRLSLNGETFLLDLPGGYTWAEFNALADEGQETLADQLAMLDGYADPQSSEVEVPRRLGGRRYKEPHLSNGAVLRRHEWSGRPTQTGREARSLPNGRGQAGRFSAVWGASPAKPTAPTQSGR